MEHLDSIEVNCVQDAAFTMPQQWARLDTPKGLSPRQIAPGELRTVLRDWVEEDKLANAIVVGLLDAQGPQVISYGNRENQFCFIQKGKHRFGVITTHPKVKGNTVFLIASITKVFTKLLLLDMVQRGDMRLDEPAQLYLPASVRLPARNGKPITLLHLATHTSGLPAWVGSDAGSLAKIYADLSKYQLSRPPGAAYEYSNIGMDLLGIAIERKAGKPYRTLLAERICQPLGMNHTSVFRCEYPGAGAIKSTADDMLKFASACLGLAPAPSALASLMRHEYATHGGGGGGCVSQLVLDHAHRRALVTLCDTVDGRYFHAGAALQRLILNPLKPSAVATKIKDAVCDDYAGQYLLDKTSVSVRRSGHRLLLQETNRPSCELFPTSQTEFMNCLFGLRATFTPGAPGQPVRLTLHNLEQNSSAAGCKTSSPVPRDTPR